MRIWHWLAIGALVALIGGLALYGGPIACSATGMFCEAAVQPEATDSESAPLAPLPEDTRTFEPVPPAPVLEDNVGEPVATTAPRPNSSSSARPRPANRPATQAAAAPPAPTPLTPPAMEVVVGVAPEGNVLEDQPDQNETVVVTAPLRPQWTRRPSDNRLAEAYPRTALERGREGEARVSCVIQNNGSLDCTRVSEAPLNAGFGMAAVRIAQTYRHGPRLENGAPSAGATVNFRVVFRIDESRRRGGPSTWH